MTKQRFELSAVAVVMAGALAVVMAGALGGTLGGVTTRGTSREA